MEFPDFEPFNKKASDYAKSGISQSTLLMEAKDTRELLVKELNEIPADKLNKSLTSNGAAHCPHTGTPYSLKHIWTIYRRNFHIDLLHPHQTLDQ